MGDFGIAKNLKSTFDKARTQIGTPYYLSPEICQERPYDHKSDVWALGVVLYEMMMLKHPFLAPNMKQLLMKIITATYTPIPARLYSPQLRGLVDACLQKDPKKRPSVNQILGVCRAHAATCSCSCVLCHACASLLTCHTSPL